MKASLVIWVAAATLVTTATARAEFPSLRAGLVLGEPLGATVTLPLSVDWELHLDAGASNTETTRVLVALDVVYVFSSVFGRVGDGSTYPWVGLGFRGGSGRGDFDGGSGLRVPFGMSFVTEGGTMEIFIQVATGLVLVPKRDTFIDGGVGIRIGI